MKKVLVVAATEMELDGIRMNPEIDLGDQHVQFLVGGVGMINTVFSLTQHLIQAELPDVIINIGIAGAFASKQEIGDVVQVLEDRFSELGVEDNEQFVAAHKMNLVAKKDVVFSSLIKLNGLAHVSGITVNTVHGNTESIENIKKLFNPDVESMEGAAVAFVAQKMNVPWIQLRAISNRVEARNRNAWDIPLALKNLQKEVLCVLQGL